MDIRGQQLGRFSPESYRLLFEASPNPIYVFDVESFRFLAVNEAAVRHYGYSREEFLGMTAKDIRPTEEVERFIASTRGMKPNASAEFAGVFHHRKKDGTLMDAEVSVSAIEFEGRPARLVVVRDVTAKRQTEKALQQNEWRFRAMLERCGEMVTVVDREGNLIEESPNIEVWLGYSPGELRGRSCFDLVHPDDLGAALPVFKELSRRPGTTFHTEVRLRTKSGAWRWFLTFATNLLEDEVVGAIVLNSRDVTEQRAVEDELRASREQLRVTVENSMDVVYRWNLETSRYDYISPVVRQILGFSDEEMREMSMNSVLARIHPDDLPRVRRTLGEVEALGRAIVDYRFKCKDGKYRWLADRFTIQKDQRGRAMFLSGTARDVTEQKQSEEALRKSEAKYRSLHDSMTDAFVSVDMTGWIREWNKAYENLLGYTGEEIRRLKYTDVTPEKWHALEAKIVAEQILPRGYSDVYEKEYRRKDGTIIPVELRTFLIRGDDGQPATMWAIVRDLTVRKQAERALQQSEALLRTSFDSVPFEFWVRDKNGVCIMENAALVKHWGSILGKHPEDANVSPETLAVWGENNRRALAGEVVREDVEYVHGGEKRFFHNIIAPVRHGEEIQGILGFNIDITDRKNLERELCFTKFGLDHSSVPSFWNDFNGRFVYVNEAACRKLGYTREELLTMSVPDVEAHHTIEVVREAWKKLQTAGSVVLEGIHRKKTGETFPVEVTITRFEFDGQQYMCAFATDISARKQVELALRQNEERLRLAQETARVGIWEWNDVTKEASWTPELEALYGFTPGTVKDVQTLVSLIHPDDSREQIKARDQAIAEHKPFDLEFRILLPSGETRWISSKGGAVYDEAGHAIRVFAVNGDITERKNTQEKLRLSEERLKLAQVSAGAGVWTWHIPSGKLEWSDELFGLFGLDPGKATASFDSWRSVVHSDDRKTAEERIEEAIEKKILLDSEYRINLPSGAIRWIKALGNAAYDNDDKPLRMSGICLDVTTRKQTEEALRESEERFAKAFQNTPMLMSLTDLETGRLVEVNEAFCQMSGFSREEMIGKTTVELGLLNAEERQQMVKQLRKHGRVSGVEYHLHKKSGEPVTCRYFAEIVHAGQRTLLLSTAEDITERKRAEEAVRQSEERLRLALEASHAGIWSRDMVHQVVSLDQRSQEMFGFAQHEPISFETWTNRVHPQDREQLLANIQAALESKTGEEWNVEFRVIHPVAGERWVEGLGHIERDATGRVIRFDGINLDITERKRAEQALRKSEEAVRARLADLESIYNSGVVGLCILDRDLRYVQINEQLAAMNGAPVAAHLGRTMREVVPHVVDLVEPRVRRLLETGEPILNWEVAGETPERPGIKRTWLGSWVPVKAVDGSVAAIHVVAMEITAHKQAEEKMRQLDERVRFYADVLERTIIPFGCGTPDGKLFSCNQAFLDLTGYSREEFEGEQVKWVQKLTPSRWRAAEAAFLAEAVRERKPVQYEKEYRRKDGTLVPVEMFVQPIFDSDGQLFYYRGFATDITRRKRAEAALRESEKRYRALFEQAGDAIVVIDPQSLALIDFNDEAYRRLGYTREEFAKLKVPDFEIKETVEETQRHCREVIEHGVDVFETKQRTKNGELLDVEVRSNPARLGEKDVVIAIWRDITTRKQVEAILVRSQLELEALVQERTAKLRNEIAERRKLEGQILEISEREQRRIGQDLHDGLGQELAGIGFLTSSLCGKLAKTSRPEAKEIKRISKLLDEAVQQVRALSRGLHPVQADPEALMSALTELAEGVRRLPGCDCSFTCLCPVRIDDQHVATNLYRIAQEAVHNAVRHGRPKHIWISLTQDKKEITLEVRDNGRGIKKLRKSRKGIGLEIMQYRAAAIGASCSVEPGPRRGTIVRCVWKKSGNTNREIT